MLECRVVGGRGERRTDLGVNLLELVLDACELLVGHLGNLVALVGHFGCVVVRRNVVVWVYELCIIGREEK